MLVLIARLYNRAIADVINVVLLFAVLLRFEFLLAASATGVAIVAGELTLLLELPGVSDNLLEALMSAGDLAVVFWFGTAATDEDLVFPLALPVDVARLLDANDASGIRIGGDSMNAGSRIVAGLIYTKNPRLN